VTSNTVGNINEKISAKIALIITTTHNNIIFIFIFSKLVVISIPHIML